MLAPRCDSVRNSCLLRFTSSVSRETVLRPRLTAAAASGDDVLNGRCNGGMVDDSNDLSPLL